MARIRNVRPTFWEDPKLEGCSMQAALLFLGMQNFCDDEGFHPVSFGLLEKRVLPLFRLQPGEIGDWVRELLNHSLLETWKIADEYFWKVSDWNQVINRPTPSKHPDHREKLNLMERSLSPHGVLMEDSLSNPKTHGVLTESSRSAHGRLTEYSVSPPRIIQFPIRPAVNENSFEKNEEKLSTGFVNMPVHNPVDNFVDNSQKRGVFWVANPHSNNISCCYNLNTQVPSTVCNINNICLFDREVVGDREVIGDKGGVGEKGERGGEEDLGGKSLFKNFHREKILAAESENSNIVKPIPRPSGDLFDNSKNESQQEHFELSQYDSSGVDILNGSTSKKTRSGKSMKIDTESVDKIFQHWKTVMGHPKTKMDEKRRAVIIKALKIGYEVDELCKAITGCSKTPHNMRDNDRGEQYDALRIILKDADQIDRFIRNCDHPPRPMTDADRRSKSNNQNLNSWALKKVEEMKREKK